MSRNKTFSLLYFSTHTKSSYLLMQQVDDNSAGPSPLVLLLGR